MQTLANHSTFLLIALHLTQCFALPNSSASPYQPRPYTIDVSPTLIQETRLKASHYRPTVDISTPAWFDGPPTHNVSQISQYIASEYDWFAYQDAINANFSHYITTVPAPGGSYPHDLDVHFIHQKSKREDAIPIILLHGWPSTSLEWKNVVADLVEPNDLSKPAFHVVAPDLPGFGFSPAPIAAGLGGPEHAAVFASLMQQLGYESYVVYSTDLGFQIALQMLDSYEERILKHVSDFYIVFPNATDLNRLTKNQTTAEESLYIASSNAYVANYSAYASIYSTLPLSIAHALNDSPTGFLAWLWQLDFGVRDLSVPFTVHELVSNVMTLFIPGVYGNIRSYKELFPALVSQKRKASKVPTAVLQWGYPKPSYPYLKNFNFVPRDWVERTANVTFFRRHSNGGHFPAYSQPEKWLGDMWEIFAKENK
ncbi:hypothetical protein QQS21_000708 [Conoideocrella luteorostrata]|uniref:Epoxide hydrolase N-terminal domain-containing protein n=1 Tax=Conoideocrella luteorostrata TaxID=1105319 RepID=A0AAJ0D1D5_9HYPO|nr:hypothetical protein QQS21_000708 [Conoideocrella luteorostrata]